MNVLVLKSYSSRKASVYKQDGLIHRFPTADMAAEKGKELLEASKEWDAFHTMDFEFFLNMMVDKFGVEA